MGDPNPEFEIIYTGFVNDDTEADIDNPPTVTCIADETSAPGSYAIEVSSGSDNNYYLLTYNGVLTVVEEPDALTSQNNDYSRSIYPNPASNKLFIRGDHEGLSVRMISITGEVILNKQLDADVLDVSAIPAGIYLFTLSSGTKTVLQEKLVID